MTTNTRKSKLSSGKQEQYVFTWKAVTGWDFNLGDSETASSLFKANVMKLREAIADYNKRIKQKLTFIRFFIRFCVNIVIISMILVSVYAIYKVAQITVRDTFIKQNAVSITVALITLLFPPIFELILKLERYRPKTALRIHLFRVLVFYLINYFTLVYSLFIMLNTLEAEMKANELYAQWDRGEQIQMAYGPAESSYNYNKSFYEYVPRVRASAFRSLREIKEENNATLTMESVPTTNAPSTLYANVPIIPTSSGTEPPKAWTTVFPNYGPFGVGVHNPKAIVIGNGHKAKVSETIYESRAVGPISVWSDVVTEHPVPLNYTSAPIQRVQFYRASKYDDLCWETLIGQEIAKIVTTDLVMTIGAILVIDFLRGLWIRYCSVWWCWDIEATFPEYGEFKVAENVLHLVNNQGMICLGTILVPMLPMINNVKLVILMYIRAWACMTCNVPAKQIFRASRSSNFYLWLLLMMLCMSTLPVGFVIWSKKPSKNCGPFSGEERFYSIISVLLHRNLNKNVVEVIAYIMSPGIVIPVLLLLILIIYFLILLVNGLRAANTDLSKQLTHERTEEKKKIFELAHGGRKRQSQGYLSIHRPSNAFQSKVDSSSSEYKTPKSSLPRGSDPFANANGMSERRGSKPMRSSWHGGESGTPSSQPTIRTVNTFGILRVPQSASMRRKAFNQQASSENEPESPSKSPVRHATFMPSLQSVDEQDSDEERSTGEGHKISHTRRKSDQKQNGDDDGEVVRQIPSPSSSNGQSEHSSSTFSTPPIQLNWRQRFMICLGIATPQGYREKQRAQRRHHSHPTRALTPTFECYRPEEIPTQVITEKTPEEMPLSPTTITLPLEEADFSESTTDSCRPDEVNKLSVTGNRSHRARSGHPSPSSPSPSLNMSERTADDQNPSQASQSDGQITMIKKLPQQPFQVKFPQQPKTSAKESEKSSMPKVAHTGANVPCYSQFPMTMRSASAGDRGQMHTGVERDLISEESPLLARRPLEFGFGGGDLSPEKRSPQQRQQQQQRIRQQRPKQLKQQQLASQPPADSDYAIGRQRRSSSRAPLVESLERGDQSDDETRPPSEEEFSYIALSPQPSTPTPRQSSDRRFSYANPYGSYAAAMCSPILPAEGTDENGMSRSQHSNVEPGSSTFHDRRFSHDSALVDKRKKFGENGRMPPHSQRPPLPTAIASMEPMEPTYTISAPRKLMGTGPDESTLENWKRRLRDVKDQAGGFNKSFSLLPGEKIDELSIRKEGSQSICDFLEPRGSLTSGRGTLPSTGPERGASSPTSSSPEFYRSRFRIAASNSPKHRHHPLQPLSDLGSGSEQSPTSSSRRRFDIRQRSALGLQPLSRNGSNSRVQRNGQKIATFPRQTSARYVFDDDDDEQKQTAV